MTGKRHWIKSFLIIVGICVGAVATALLVFVLFILYAIRGMCGYNELERVRSDNGEYDAVLVTHDCGATTAYSYHVCVVPKDGTDYSRAVFTADRVDQVEEFDLKWSSGKLVVTLPQDYEEGKRKDTAEMGWRRTVKVEYREQ